MNHYKDFTYYSHEHFFENSINIGWTNNTKGNVCTDELFLEKLVKHLDYPFHKLRGAPFETKKIFIFSREYLLGYSELRILDQTTKKKYAVPDMIVYRIIEGQYAPPIEFIEAVKNSFDPESIEYQSYISRFNSENLWGESEKYIKKNKDILDIIENNSVIDFQKTITNDESLLSFVTEKGSLLNAAIHYQRTDIAKWLLSESDIDINIFNGIELLTAIEKEYMDIIIMLLDRKIMMRDDELLGNPLFIAVSEEKELATKVILDYTGKDLMQTYNSPYYKDMDIFKLAEIRGNKKIIDALKIINRESFEY